MLHRNNSPHVNMSLHLDTSIWCWVDQLIFLILNTCWAEKQNTNFKSLVWLDWWLNTRSTIHCKNKKKKCIQYISNHDIWLLNPFLWELQDTLYLSPCAGQFCELSSGNRYQYPVLQYSLGSIIKPYQSVYGNYKWMRRREKYVKLYLWCCEDEEKNEICETVPLVLWRWGEERNMWNCTLSVVKMRWRKKYVKLYL